ncbi:insulinase family protein [Candidatus Daviesbacteria bacterium]|nr:insulinase family protein [Candidatus Daviesbacteria bacterium]
MLKTFTLKNGIKVATYNLPNVKSIHIRISSKGGSIVESKVNNGVAHFMEHILVQGTPSYPTVEDLSLFIESLAGNYNAQTEKLLISFFITTPATHIEDAIKITKEVFFDPLFAKDAIERERGALLNEIKQNMDSHYFELNRYFWETRVKKEHPLTLFTGGALDVVSKLTRDDLVNYWQKYFLSKNSYLLISGNFEEKKLIKLLEKYFESIDSKKVFSGFPKMSDLDLSEKEVFIRFDQKLGINYIDITWPSIKMEDTLKLRLIQNLALTILGGLRNSRLFKLLRSQRGLVYSIGSSASILPGLGLGYISSQVTSENLVEVLDLTFKELFTFVHNGPTDEELSFAKNYLSNQWFMAFDHPSVIAEWIENDLHWNDKIRLPEQYLEILKEIKKEDLLKLMQKYWDFAKLNLVIQGQIEDSKENREKYMEYLNL